jgi:nucleotide-binding universal stress UspA family protein
MAVRSILVATDFSECASDALELALELAEKQRARLTIVHAWAAPRISGGVETAPLVQMPGLPGVTLTEYVRDDAERSLRALTEQLADRGVVAESRLVFGDPRDVIVELSAQHDLVVMGTHGRGGLSRLILGSVADYVVRHALCPVVTVRPAATRG